MNFVQWVEHLMNYSFFFGCLNLWIYIVLDKRGHIERWSTYSPSKTFRELVECVFCTSQWIAAIEITVTVILLGDLEYISTLLIIPVITTLLNSVIRYDR